MTEPSPPLSPTKDPLTTPPNSASSSSADKKTREQPNLSDCHCCGRRINHTNPEDRLQPLDSVWRIVLLCSKCHKKVSAGQTCPYCFKQTGNSGDLVTCTVCKSRIHEICVKDYGNCTPWCNLGLGLGEFKTCVDCWVPDSLKSSMRIWGRNEYKGVPREDDYGDTKDGLGKRPRNAKFEVAKKWKMAAKAKAKEQEFRKAMATKKASDLAFAAKKGGGGQKGGDSNSSNAIEIDDAELAIQLRRVFNSPLRMSRSEFFLDPMDLNVWKIRNWNGISYKRPSLGIECAKGQNMYSSNMEKDTIDWTQENGSSSDANGFELRLSTYKRDKKRKIWQIDDANPMVFESSSIQTEEKFELHSDDARTSCSTDVSESLLCVDANENVSHTDIDRCISEALLCDNADQTSSCVNVDRFAKNHALYKRTRFRPNAEVNAMINVSGECGFFDSHEVTCKPEYRPPDDEEHMMHFVVKCEAEKIMPHENCNSEHDRYFLKYFKRTATTKSYLIHPHSDTVQCEKQASAPALSNSQTDSLKCDGELSLPNESSDAGLERYCFKYVKRKKGSKCASETKLRSDLIQHQNEDFAPGLIVRPAVESRTMSSCT